MTARDDVTHEHGTRTPEDFPNAAVTGAADASAPAGGDREQEPYVDLRLRVRRAPNVWAFVAAGFIAGVLAGAAVDLLGPAPGSEAAVAAGATVQYGRLSSVFFLGALFGLIGALVGGIVAVILDRRS